MKLVSTLVVARDDADILDAHLRFHLNAGVDLVLVAGADGEDEIAAILEPFVQSGHVELVSGTAASLASLATSERGADWVLPAEADEFWWPRGESLKDVLAAIPPRYEIVQGLVRVFTAAAETGEPVFERMTLRSSLLHSSEARRRAARVGAPAPVPGGCRVSRWSRARTTTVASRCVPGTRSRCCASRCGRRSRRVVA